MPISLRVQRIKGKQSFRSLAILIGLVTSFCCCCLFVIFFNVTLFISQVVVLIDTSGSMVSSMDELKRELVALVWDQIRHLATKYVNKTDDRVTHVKKTSSGIVLIGM